MTLVGLAIGHRQQCPRLCESLSGTWASCRATASVHAGGPWHHGPWDARAHGLWHESLETSKGGEFLRRLESLGQFRAFARQLAEA